MKAVAALVTGFFLWASNPSTDDIKTKSQLYVSNYENVLGTSLEFKFTTTSDQIAEKAERAALNEIARLSAILSTYDSTSEFSRWMNADLNKPVKVSKELFEMLSLFDQWKQRSNGALDASIAVATTLWEDAEKAQKLPTANVLQQAVSQMKQRHYMLDAKNQTATRLTHSPLVLNTFTKSYIINLACDAALRETGIETAVVNIGGDLVVKGRENDLIKVTNPLANAENDAPLDMIQVNNRAVATSGNYRRGEQIGKKWFSHIVDPRTAMPVEGVISATVIAPNAVDAGALATAFNVLSIDESEELASTVPDVEYLIVTHSGKRIESKGWAKLAEPKVVKVFKPELATRADKPWDAKFELEITLNLNAIQGNTHRPFAAIWVENADRKSVRNLALWYNKTKWVPDLRNWYRINGERFKANKENYASVTGATRSPGKYTIKWDGKDDQGNFVPQGNYTIMIESSKEHGTDEIIRQPLELKKSAKKVTIAGNVEISNVTFDFHKK